MNPQKRYALHGKIHVFFSTRVRNRDDEFTLTLLDRRWLVQNGVGSNDGIEVLVPHTSLPRVVADRLRLGDSRIGKVDAQHLLPALADPGQAPPEFVDAERLFRQLKRDIRSLVLWGHAHPGSLPVTPYGELCLAGACEAIKVMNHSPPPQGDAIERYILNTWDAILAAGSGGIARACRVLNAGPPERRALATRLHLESLLPRRNPDPALSNPGECGQGNPTPTPRRRPCL